MCKSWKREREREREAGVNCPYRVEYLDSRVLSAFSHPRPQLRVSEIFSELVTAQHRIAKATQSTVTSLSDAATPTTAQIPENLHAGFHFPGTYRS